MFRKSLPPLLLVTALLLGLWQAGRLRELLPARPSPATMLQQETAAWLARETPPDATLLAAETIGELAGRTTQTLPAAPPAEQVAQVAATLPQNPVDFAVAENTLAWDLIREALWFRLAYVPVQQFSAPGVSTAPITIFAYRPPHEELGPRQVMNARVPDKLSVLGFQVGPDLPQAGDTIRLLLALQAPPVGRPPQQPFEAIVRLVSPLDGSTAAEWTAVLPATTTPQAWAPGQVVDELLALPLPAGLPAGGYLLNLSLRDDQIADLWPFSFNNDVNRLDRVPLGWLAVPQQDAPPPEHKLDALFEGGIRLAGSSTGPATPGAELPVTLYWQAEGYVGEEYAIFVHLLDAEGNLVAGHDGRPAAGRFPTPSWRPGLTVADAHPLALPQDLPPGEYTLRAGLYDPKSGTRLPLAAGGDAAELGAITIAAR